MTKITREMAQKIMQDATKYRERIEKTVEMLTQKLDLVSSKLKTVDICLKNTGEFNEAYLGELAHDFTQAGDMIGWAFYAIGDAGRFVDKQAKGFRILSEA